MEVNFWKEHNFIPKSYKSKFQCLCHMTDFSKNNHFPYLYLAMKWLGHFGSEVLATFPYEFPYLQSISFVHKATKCKVIILSEELSSRIPERLECIFY